jgi:hypothetical protein
MHKTSKYIKGVQARNAAGEVELVEHRMARYSYILPMVNYQNFISIIYEWAKKDIVHHELW